MDKAISEIHMEAVVKDVNDNLLISEGHAKAEDRSKDMVIPGNQMNKVSEDRDTKTLNPERHGCTVSQDYHLKGLPFEGDIVDGTDVKVVPETKVNVIADLKKLNLLISESKLVMEADLKCENNSDAKNIINATNLECANVSIQKSNVTDVKCENETIRESTIVPDLKDVSKTQINSTCKNEDVNVLTAQGQINIVTGDEYVNALNLESLITAIKADNIKSVERQINIVTEEITKLEHQITNIADAEYGLTVKNQMNVTNEKKPVEILPKGPTTAVSEDEVIGSTVDRPLKAVTEDEEDSNALKLDNLINRAEIKVESVLNAGNQIGTVAEEKDETEETESLIATVTKDEDRNAQTAENQIKVSAGENTVKDEDIDGAANVSNEKSKISATAEVKDVKICGIDNQKEPINEESVLNLITSESKGEAEKLSGCTICSDKTSSEHASSTPKNTDDDFTPPDDELCEKVIRQVEYCFSDFNIMKDSFLLKHVRRNKEGYVSLKLVASFRKVKSLTKDWRVVAHCVEKSSKLKINEEKTKVCRVDPIPDFKDTPIAKTVVVFNLPFENPTTENVNELFSKFGAVVSAKIMMLGSELDNPYAKRCLAYHNEVASQIYAMIEFQDYDHAMGAIKDEQGHLAKENGLKVVPLLSQAYKNKTKVPKPQDRQKRNGRAKAKANFQQKSQKDSASSDEHLAIERQKGDFVETNKVRTVLSNEEQNALRNGNYRRYSRGRKQAMFPNNNCNQPQYYPGEHAYSCQGDGIGRQPLWQQRRQMIANRNYNFSSYPGPVMKARQPVGPDGTRGFHHPNRFALAGKI